MKRYLAALALISTGVSAQTVTTQTLDTATALALVGDTIEACREDGYRVSVTVVDSSGLLKAQARHEKAGPHTLDSSRRKAFTAASLQAPTAKYAQLVDQKPELFGLREMHDDILLLGGGLPIRIDGELVGGIGVGGAPGGHLDAACAQAALDKVLKP